MTGNMNGKVWHVQLGKKKVERKSCRGKGAAVSDRTDLKGPNRGGYSSHVLRGKPISAMIDLGQVFVRKTRKKTGGNIKQVRQGSTM